MDWAQLVGPDLFPETASAATAVNTKMRRHKRLVARAAVKRQARSAASRSAKGTSASGKSGRSSRSRRTARTSDESSSDADSSEDGEGAAGGQGRSERSGTSRSGSPARPRYVKRSRSRASRRDGGSSGAGRRGVKEDSDEGASAKENGAGPSSRFKKARRTSDPHFSTFLPSPSPSTHSPSLSLATSTLSTLSVFLAGLNPSLIPLAPPLGAAGLDSLDALTKLALLEPSSVALMLEGMRQCAEPPVSVVQLRLLGRQLKEAGRALRA